MAMDSGECATRPCWTGWRRGLCLLLLAAPVLAGAFDLQGHRGARGLAPENTLAAFATALRLGVTTLELDLGVTSDQVLVIAHDSRLNPALTRDASGRWLEQPGPALNSLTLEALRRYDVGRLRPGTRYAQTYPEQQAVEGERIPSFDELVGLLAERGARTVRLNVETKLTPLEPALAPDPATFAALVVDSLRRHGLMQRASVQSFDWRSLREVQRLAPEIATVALTARQSWLDNLSDGRWTAGLRLSDHGQSVPRLVKASGATTWSPYHGELSSAEVAEAQALGLKVVPWTVNDPARIAQLLDWKVDGLISDHPDRVRQVMAARGLPLPPGWPPR
jgi:glycerophosphoryl diester phosphodiesterase